MSISKVLDHISLAVLPSMRALSHSYDRAEAPSPGGKACFSRLFPCWPCCPLVHCHLSSTIGGIGTEGEGVRTAQSRTLRGTSVLRV